MTTEPKIRIFSGSSHPALAKAIAKYLKMPLSEMVLKRFANGEVYARPVESVRNADVFIVQTATQNVNEDLMELFVMIDSCKRSFAYKVHVVLPLFPYCRQDRVVEPREPISAKLVANLISHAGADHVMTINLHSKQTQGFFDFPVDNLTARSLFIEYFKKKKLKNLTIVSPDVGGAKVAKKMADALDAEMAIFNKVRPKHNQARTTHVVGEVKGRTCILFDDMIDTGGSVCEAKRVLVETGANKDVYVAATHAVFSSDAVAKLKAADFKEIIVSDSIPLSVDATKLKNLKVISVAPLLAKIINNVHLGKAVTPIIKPNRK